MGTNMKDKLEEQVNDAIINGLDKEESAICNVNAVTSGFVISPASFHAKKVCTLPKILGAWMKENKLNSVVVREYGFVSKYILDDNGRAKEIFE